LLLVSEQAGTAGITFGSDCGRAGCAGVIRCRCLPATAAVQGRAAGNTVGSVSNPNAFGVLLREQSRGSGACGPHAVVGGNSITLCGTSTPPVATTYNGADTSVDNSVYTSGDQLSANQYTVSSATLPAFRWLTSAGAGNGWLTFAQWKHQG